MEKMFVLFAKLKKSLIIFTTNIEIVTLVTLKEALNVTMKTKIKYQINKNYIMKKKTCVTSKVKNKSTKQKISYTTNKR